MKLTYKYRLNPTNKQQFLLNDLLFQMQTVYNDTLNERRWLWNRSRRSVSYYDQWRRIKQERYQYYGEMDKLNVTSIQRMLRRVDNAYQAFYRGIRGLPRFKSRHRFKSVVYRHGDGSKLTGDQLYIQHIGQIKVRLHRPIPEDAKIKMVVVKHNAGKWYVCFQIEVPDLEPVIHTGEAIGIDVGIRSLLALSDGTLIANPRWLRHSLRKKRILNRKLSRQKRFSSGWRKTRQQIARLDEHIANQRRDFWHKQTTKLARQYALIVVEDLNLSFMLRNGNLSLSAHDAGLGLFFNLLRFKVEKAGSTMVKVDPKYSSQRCSGCGVIVKKGLNVRVHECFHCGLTLDRDVNAALNILSPGQSDGTLTCPVKESVVPEAPPL